ncbi:MAG: DNA gyrase subunit A, partial [Candidatus Izemoplasmatales bacterium]|nr:DNA gyrase subunit A [Candidatus Izemoplasmatales bacterium]
MAKSVKKKLDDYLEEKIISVNLEEIVGERFGRYSKYIIQDRALPDVRDGLKPVQRRILFAMNELGMGSTKPYKKSARIVGEVIGKYHPHGDTSVYDAMVRMSQNWKMGTLLIDMHGNNGSVDNDPAAAMRYTEARLTVFAEALLKDIDKKTVTFIPNFDDCELEPVVLPAKFPNILVNGATGM